MEFAQAFAQHSSCDFRVPVIERAEQSEQNSANNYVMKMRDDEIRAAELPVERCSGQHDACKPGNQELEQERDAEQHGRLELNLASPHGAQPVEDFDTCRYADNHRGYRKKAVC